MDELLTKETNVRKFIYRFFLSDKKNYIFQTFYRSAKAIKQKRMT